MDDLRGIDLNLVVVLDAILTHGNLTRAGEAIGLTQPAVSGAAAKLRKLLDDPILVRTGRTSVLTSKARALQPVVREAVLAIRQTLSMRPAFDPQSTERRFRVTASDYALAFMAAPLLEVIEQEAPGVTVEFTPMSNIGVIDLLREDVAVASAVNGVPGKRQSLFTDSMVCIVREGHPRLVDGALTEADLRTLPYVQVHLADGVVMYADDALAAAGITPRVVRRVPGFLPVAFAVAGTDMFGFVPARLAQLYASELGLVAASIPVHLPVLIESAFWHPSRTTDPALRWLLGTLRTVAERIEFDHSEE